MGRKSPEILLGKNAKIINPRRFLENISRNFAFYTPTHFQKKLARFILMFGGVSGGLEV